VDKAAVHVNDQWYTPPIKDEVKATAAPFREVAPDPSLRIELEQLQVEIVKLSRIVDDRQHGLPAAK